MTKFADQLFDDLMQEHGPALARTRLVRTPMIAPTPSANRNVKTPRIPMMT